jgi:hypothetical protein
VTVDAVPPKSLLLSRLPSWRSRGFPGPPDVQLPRGTGGADGPRVRTRVASSGRSRRGQRVRSTDRAVTCRLPDCRGSAR